MKRILGPELLNGLSLVAIQGGNAIFPLIVFPLLLSSLGWDAFSTLVVAEALAFYVLTICLYGFDLLGVKYIIEASQRGEDGAEIYFNILVARMILFTIAAVFFSGFYYVFGVDNFIVFFVWLFFPLGMVLQSNYYFQAIERNFYLAFVILVSRFLAILAIYFFVKVPADLLLASLILVGSFLASGAAVFFLMLLRFGLAGLGFVKPRLIYDLLYDGRHVFLGGLSVVFFRGSNVLVLAVVSTSLAVSSYSLAEKIIKSTQALARPLNQFFTPRVIKEWGGSGKTNSVALSILWRNTKLQVALMLCVMPVIVFVMYISFSHEYFSGLNEYSLILVLLMSPAVVFGVANAMFGALGLSLIGAQSYFATAVFIVGVLALLFSIVVSPFWGGAGAAVSFVLGEVLLLISFLCRFHWRAAGL
ncbi:oligosaccharide flippase family protein [Ectopseudomonas mendocina]|uniref:oligosaccharide flippase family protein n=1 Tax=Ectopseudomonas mendocina TaxID=300 RepID=UPI0023EBE9B6|nr:oligosaccharide flippase family protein [Pseudomonas mendocina]